ncbi:MAG: zinc-binding dehydrogenase [Acidimicrobiales bacterium]
MKGRVAALVGPEKVALKEFEVPAPSPGAAVLRVRRANVCGSDVHVYHYDSPALQRSVLGHEFVGEVVALGDGVTEDYAGRPVSLGDRVVAVYFLACQRCSGCRQGDFSLCKNALRSWATPPDEPPHFRGAFATHYYIEPNQYFYKVPDALSDRAVAGANCGLAQVLFVMDRLALCAGETLVVQGAGGLGLYATAVGKERGATVVVIDGVPERLDLATRFGADHVVDMAEYPSPEARVDQLQTITKGGNVVIEVTGVAAAFVEAMNLAAVGGRIASVGNLNVGTANEVTMLPAVLTRKHLSVHGILRYDPWYLDRAISFLERNNLRFPFESVTGRDYALDDVVAALESGASREVSRASVVPPQDG